jgi:hypothetical protein
VPGSAGLFSALNSTVAATFGEPVDYFPLSPLVAAFTITAVVDTPHSMADQFSDVMKHIWVDGGDAALNGYTPAAGDTLRLADQTQYSVNLVEYDSERGVNLICRRMDP